MNTPSFSVNSDNFHFSAQHEDSITINKIKYYQQVDIFDQLCSIGFKYVIF